MSEVEIGERKVGPAHPPFVVAEAGINHNGDVEKAFAMVRVAKASGADAIKFQTFKAEEFVGDPAQTFTYKSQGQQITESMLEMFKRYELSRDDWFAIKRECERAGIIFLSTPQNCSDLDLLLDIGIAAVKIGSDDFANLPLLKSYADTGLPLILSCGMADMGEVYCSLNAVGALDGYPTVLLLCTSQYPTPPQDVNLRKLATLQTAFPQVVIGFSDHTQGPLASSLASALGASVFEKHFTLDHGLPGPDHWFSDDPEGLKQWVADIRRAKLMLGSPVVRPTQAEREMRILVRRSIVALRDIRKDEVYTNTNVGIRRPGHGLAPELMAQVLGAKAVRHLTAGECLGLGDFVR